MSGLSRQDANVEERAATGDPGVGFWLRYVEAEGALSEDQGDHALVVLPDALQQRFAVDDVVAVTADPEVAREDGAMLLLPGHPMLDGAAASAVERGDAGVAWLPWPGRRSPGTSELLDRAREIVGVEHGRIDRDQEAARAWLPVLRAGARATTTASLDLRFQERHEVWVDARAGAEAPDALIDSLTGSPWDEAPEQRHAVLTLDLARSIEAADRLLSARATDRARRLSTAAAQDRRDALARVDSYYTKALGTISERRAAATDDERRALLDAQAEATQLERQRRIQEVEDTHRVRFELQPFRLHMVMVPALRLRVQVRRGASTFPLELVWMLPTRTFAAVACPHCGAEHELVAGRQRLGCTSCLPRSVPAVNGARATPDRSRNGSADAEESADADGSAGADEGDDAGQGGGGDDTGTAPGPRPARARPASTPARRPAPQSESQRSKAHRSAEQVQAAGDRLTLRFWDEVAQGRRWHRRRVAANSPLTTLHRLYGKNAPFVAIGVPPGDRPESVQAFTPTPEPGLPCITHGDLLSRHAAWSFTLRWAMTRSGPLLLELLPGLPMLDGHLPTEWTLDREVTDRLFGPADPPTRLDPVAEALWWSARPIAGLPLVVRCLTAWWRIHDDLDLAMEPAVLAAALTSLVENRSGLRRPRAQAAADHAVSTEEVATAARRLQRRLELSSQRPW